VAVENCRDFASILGGGIVVWVNDKKVLVGGKVFAWPVTLAPFDNQHQAARLPWRFL
jgi:hypothetical protein